MKAEEQNFGLHEVLDRSFMLAQNWDHFVRQHPVVVGDAELRKAAAEIGEALGAFYQMVGAR